MKQRVAVIGAAGFVGSAIVKALDPNVYQAVGISRKDCDLSAAASRAALAALIKDGDIVVCAAAKAPAKNLEMLIENIAIMGNIVGALQGKALAYVLNISSDAVYADSVEPLDESSLVAPLNAHGIMHAMRETMLEKNMRCPVGHLRPTLIYGENDPHNGYGPNAFIRLARGGQPIALFGEGEEQRDHIYIGDVAKLAAAMIAQKTPGAINAATGKTISFMEIARLTGAEIISKPRPGPMPHNGYRAFDNARARALCPGLTFQDLGTYIAAAVKAAA